MKQFMYSFLVLLRNKSLLFWTLMFPLILGTLFNLAFSNLMSSTENFSMIPVAVVASQNNYFTDVLNELSDGDDALIAPTYTDMADAEQLLENGDIEGIFVAEQTLRLVVMNEGLNQSILKTISDSYIQSAGTVSTIASNNPNAVAAAMEAISSAVDTNSEITLGRGETNSVIQYFYALIAMTCLFGSYLGVANILSIQANRSPVAARRSISPKRKISMILYDFAAAVLLMFLMNLIVIAYLTFVLGIDFGNTWVFTILTAFVGSLTGVSLGTFAASLIKASDVNLVTGILTGVSLILSFLSGLMFHSIKYLIEQHVPIINRINPAALLTDAFYSLVVYDSYARYTTSIVSLLIISALLCIGSAFVLRRTQYASI